MSNFSLLFGWLFFLGGIVLLPIGFLATTEFVIMTGGFLLVSGMIGIIGAGLLDRLDVRVKGTGATPSKNEGFWSRLGLSDH